ncbi:hypothetical protein KUCAC02_012163 [Chaenocephalus aceratus]|uniref:Uncharacterized protein n=1 Tax=Chaenocephalus aceratus TaxID=36190 RepID=A0ACB9XBJ3_CHAAC|nr:hypothetical protein KUCAC02_012163 [Chaenocephalus aceratus]
MWYRHQQLSLPLSSRALTIPEPTVPAPPRANTTLSEFDMLAAADGPLEDDCASKKSFHCFQLLFSPARPARPGTTTRRTRLGKSVPRDNVYFVLETLNTSNSQLHTDR